MTVDAALYIEALTEQRNKAMNDLAVAMARSVQFQRENEKLRSQLSNRMTEPVSEGKAG